MLYLFFRFTPGPEPEPGPEPGPAPDPEPDPELEPEPELGPAPDPEPDPDDLELSKSSLVTKAFAEQMVTAGKKLPFCFS